MYIVRYNKRSSICDSVLCAGAVGAGSGDFPEEIYVKRFHVIDRAA